MSLKDSLEKVKSSKEGLKKEVEETRRLVKDLRPRPLRNIVDRRMTDIRPFKRFRKRLSANLEPQQSHEGTQ